MRIIGSSAFASLVLALSALSLTPSLGCAPAPSRDDGGVSDDAGADAGEDPCAGADAVLGTLTLGAGFTVVDSVPMPEGIVALRAVPEGEQRRLYGVDVAQASVVDLGLWPLGEATVTKVFAVTPPDVEGDVYPSWFLAFDGARLATGYTGTFDTETFLSPGTVSLYDVAADEVSGFVDAPNNFAGDFVGDTLVIHAAALGDVAEGTAVYGLGDEPFVLARYAAPETTYGGPVIGTRDGRVVVAGYSLDTSMQHFFLLSAEDVSAARAGEAVELAAAEEIVAAPSLTAARFGDDLAYVHGDAFTPFEAVRRVSLASGASRDPVDVLSFVDTCTAVDLLADLDDDLLVAVSDDAGRRLLRIREDG